MKAFYLLALIFFAHFSYAAEFRFGIMAGANTAINQFYIQSPIQSIDSKLGFNANLFARVKLSKFIFQPEIGYLYNRVGINILENSKLVDGNLSLGQLYTAGLLGIKFGTLRLTAGPMVVFLANQNFQQLNTSESFIEQATDSKRASWGAMLGLGFDFGNRWSIDTRASRTFSESPFNAQIQSNTSSFTGNSGVLSLSIGYTLFKTP